MVFRWRNSFIIASTITPLEQIGPQQENDAHYGACIPPPLNSIDCPITQTLIAMNRNMELTNQHSDPEPSVLPPLRTGGLLVGVSPLPAAFCSARASSLCFFSCLVSGLYLWASFKSWVAGQREQRMRLAIPFKTSSITLLGQLKRHICIQLPTPPHN